MDNTRLVRIGCKFRYSSAFDVSSVFQVEPQSPYPPSINAGVVLRDEKWQAPSISAQRSYTDMYQNRCRRVELPAGESVVSFSAIAEVPDATEEVNLDAVQLAPSELPDHTLIYTVPSRFCLPDELGAEAWRRFGEGPRGYARVQAIIDHIHDSVTFQYGTTNSWSTARDVYESGYGVCRDFAHLAITFCRALNIPARYAFGYLPSVDAPEPTTPMDFAAWMQVWLGDRWYTFDPRNNAHRKGRVLIGIGRDAADVAMVTTYGNPWLQQMTVVAEEIRADEVDQPVIRPDDPATDAAPPALAQPSSGMSQSQSQNQSQARQAQASSQQQNQTQSHSQDDAGNPS